MPSAIATFAQTSVNASLAPVTAGRRTPFYLQSQQQWLFAWLHRHEPLSCDHGIILCPPIGYEQLRAHRALRHLADALAEAGFPVLRLDYHGTGDSAGTDADPDRHATWLANLRDARQWMQDQLGCQRITLIGLRLGAALAVQVAEAQAVDGLLLWAPVVKGRSYVREMKALSLTASGAASAGSSPEIEAAGFVLTEQTARELSNLDLLKCRPRCRRALIVARADAPADSALLEHLTALGIEAKQTTQPGYAEMMAEPHYSQIPRQAIAQAVAWLLAERPCEAASIATPEERAWPSQAILPHEPPIRERLVYLSRQPELFGIVSEPCNAAANPLPCVVMLNAGSCYRVGPNRLYVGLARQLAARGFRCVRMDLAGLGDSAPADDGRENDPYPATAFRDIDLTLQCLQTQLGAKRVVLLGLCSGAYAAFQAAALLSSPVLGESILINPLTFYWRDGMSLDVSPAKQLQSYQACVQALWQPKKWLKLLCGKTRLGIGGVLKILMARWWPRLSGGRTSATTSGGASPVPLAHPVKEDLAGDLRRIARAGRQLTFFFSQSDPGYALLMESATRQAKALCAAGKIHFTFIEDADHTFSRRGPRKVLIDAITDHLCRSYAACG